LYLEVDVFGVPEAQMRLIVAKIQTSVSVVNAHWYPL
jgi:hypothetical protein